MSKREEAKKDIQKFSSISAVADTDGGKVLIASLQKDIVSSVDELCTKYRSASHIELIAMCSRLSERLTILRTFNRAKKNVKLSKEALEFLIQEELD